MHPKKASACTAMTDSISRECCAPGKTQTENSNGEVSILYDIIEFRFFRHKLTQSQSTITVSTSACQHPHTHHPGFMLIVLGTREIDNKQKLVGIAAKTNTNYSGKIEKKNGKKIYQKKRAQEYISIYCDIVYMTPIRRKNKTDNPTVTITAKTNKQ